MRSSDLRHGWLVIGKMDIIKSEVRLLTKADNQNALAVLRYKVCSIDHLVAYVIPEFFFQDLFDHTKSVALVMVYQVLDVFKKKGSRELGGNNSRHIEKQGSLCFVGKNVR